MKSLRVLRQRLFLTQPELAEKAGISHITLCRLENKRQKPSFKTIRKLAKALGVEPEEIKF